MADLFKNIDLSESDPENIVVWFSCGAASTVTAKKTIEKYGHDRVRLVNIFIAEEDSDNRRFLNDVSDWLNHEIEDCYNPAFPSGSAVSVFDYRKAMSFPTGAPCTQVLKKEARYIWERSNPVKWHVLGFTADEEKRFKDFIVSERSNVLPILIDAGITKADCYKIILEAGLALPMSYIMGLPNANCIGCVKATSPTYWNLIRQKWPDTFWSRALQSRRLGARLTRCHPKYLEFCYLNNKGEWINQKNGDVLNPIDPETGKRKLNSPRIFLDELPEEALGRPLKDMDFECGIFCNPEKLNA